MADGAEPGDFSFPILPPPRKDPLTARSTVYDASKGTKKEHVQPTYLAQRAKGKPLLTQLIFSFIAWFRNVPLEKGFSQVNWLQLTRSNPNLDGQGGAPLRRDIPVAEVKLHNRNDDAWTVLRDKVYNITPYLKFHPGGPEILMKAAGKDCTSLFMKYHAWVNADALLEKCLIGFVAKPDMPPCSSSKSSKPSHASSAAGGTTWGPMQQYNKNSEQPPLPLSTSLSASSSSSSATTPAAAAVEAAPNISDHLARPAIENVSLGPTEGTGAQQPSS